MTPETKPEAKPKSKAGRKKIEIDAVEMVRLAAMGFTQQQIAEGLGVSVDTLQRRLAENADLAFELKKGRISANSVIANRLFEKALSGDTASLIWWEKTRSGFSERQVLDVQTDQQFTLNIGSLRKVDVQTTLKANPLEKAVEHRPAAIEAEEPENG